MNRQPLLSNRSPLVEAANHLLPRLWKAHALARPELDAGHLLEAARTSTGLDDFGDPWFLRPMGKLLAALRDEAELNAVGRFGAYGQLLKTLRERLWTEHWFRSHPEIGDRALSRPVVIVGPMRSGTTRLHRLLAVDERFAHLRLFETICPAPAPTFAGPGRPSWDLRRAKAAMILGAVHRLNPNTAVIHPSGPTQPEEELGLLVASMWGMKHEAQWQVPGYGRWSERQSATPAYRHMARLLQLVGWARGDDDRRPWVLKTPQHTLDLPALLRVFPDARIIFTHRMPRAVVGSSCSLVWNQTIIHSDRVDPQRVGSEWLRKSGLQIARMRQSREALASHAYVDVRYEDMERDWSAVMRRIYTFLDLDIAPALPAMERYIAVAERRRRRSLHRYSLAAFGLDGNAVDEKFADYADAFGLPAGVASPAGTMRRPSPDGGERRSAQAGKGEALASTL